jgi:predicted O-methyltransferase YrrM
MRRCAQTWEAEMTAEEHELLLRCLTDARLTGAHLEIGTAAGGTLCAMMRCFTDEERPRFVSVDRMTYFPNQFQVIRENLRHHGLNPEEVDFRATTSARAFGDARRRNERFDFILIDGSHKVVAVAADLRWTRLLNVGGIVCFHDYAERFPGVWLTVNRFRQRYPNYAILGRAGSLLALRKTAASPRQEISPIDRAHSLLWHVPLEVRRKYEKWTSQQKQAA